MREHLIVKPMKCPEVSKLLSSDLSWIADVCSHLVVVFLSGLNIEGTASSTKSVTHNSQSEHSTQLSDAAGLGQQNAYCL